VQIRKGNKMSKVLAEYVSSSNSDVIYHVSEDSKGIIWCDCPGWKFNKKSCKHLKDYLTGAHKAENVIELKGQE
jgi:hypothetical protein